MEIVTLNKSEKLSKADLKVVTECLNKGGVVVMPTDTSYGLSARVDKVDSMKTLFALKGRSKSKTVSMVVKTMKQASEYGKLCKTAKLLAKHFWPGALTLVLPSIKRKLPYVRREDGTIALRQVPLAVTSQVLKTIPVPLTITSANRSGLQDVYSLEEFQEQYHGRQMPMIFIDAGRLCPNKPSTVISIEDGKPLLHRQGPITKKQLTEALQA